MKPKEQILKFIQNAYAKQSDRFIRRAAENLENTRPKMKSFKNSSTG